MIIEPRSWWGQTPLILLRMAPSARKWSWGVGVGGARPNM